MFRKIKKLFVPIISLLLVFVMVFMTACSNNPNNSTGNGNNPSEGTIVTPGDENQGGGSSDDGGGEAPTEPTEPIKFVEDDSANFIYNLVYNDLRQQYDTFAGYVSLPNSDEDVYGIAYTDYEEGYVNEQGEVYYSSGFISFPQEASISAVEISDGLEVHSLDIDEESIYSYAYTYSTEDIHKHCIIDNQYVSYDIVDGVLSFSQKKYEYGMDVDWERGDIYNYDTNSYEYIVTGTDYVPTVGASLLGDADYQAIVDEINHIISSQEANLTFADVETFVAYATEALNSYILGLQEESFMGIPTVQLKEFAKSLNPLEHLQIKVDEDGNLTIDIIKVEKLATWWEKVLTSVVCAYGVVAGIACNVLGNALAAVGFVPAKFLLGAAGGALLGISIEAFSQVVISGAAVSEMQWAQIGVAAVSGAISGAITAGLSSSQYFTRHILLREITDTLCDGMVGGAEFFANSLIAGQSFAQACTNFGYGVMMGITISGTFKVVGQALKSTKSWIKKSLSASVSEIDGGKVTKLADDVLEEHVTKYTAGQGARNVTGEVLENLSDQPYSKGLSRWKGAGAIDSLDFGKADALRKSISETTTLGSHIDDIANSHFDLTRAARNNVDSVFTNANRGNFVANLVEDFKNCQMYLKEVTDYNYANNRFTRYGYFVKDSLSMEGCLLSDISKKTKSYRVLIDVFSDGRVEIFDAYPEFRFTDFSK